MRFLKPMKEGLSTESWLRVEVRGCEWIAKMCLYLLLLRVCSFSPRVSGGVGGGDSAVVGIVVDLGVAETSGSVVSEMEMEVADREAILAAGEMDGGGGGGWRGMEGGWRGDGGEMDRGRWIEGDGWEGSM